MLNHVIDVRVSLKRLFLSKGILIFFSFFQILTPCPVFLVNLHTDIFPLDGIPLAQEKTQMIDPATGLPQSPSYQPQPSIYDTGRLM